MDHGEDERGPEVRGRYRGHGDGGECLSADGETADGGDDDDTLHGARRRLRARTRSVLAAGGSLRRRRRVRRPRNVVTAQTPRGGESRARRPDRDRRRLRTSFILITPVSYSKRRRRLLL